MQDTQILKELVTLTEEALDVYFAESDTMPFAAMFTDDATYFDPNTGGRRHGEAIRDHFAAFLGKIPPLRWEVRDPAVAMLGEAAVFTFSVPTWDPETDASTGVWNATQIHVPADGGWKMIHAHWSLEAA